jgi:hypothetical protein
LLAAPAVFAIVGHDAPSIRPGTFATGNYVFPQNVTVTNNAIINGNVGIGTANPVSGLDVGSFIHIGNLVASGAGAYLYNAGPSYGIAMIAYNFSGGYAMPIAFTSKNLTLSTYYSMNGVPAIYIGEAPSASVSGNVGIGTAIPANKLNVEYGSSAPTGTIADASDLAGYATILSATGSAINSKTGLIAAFGSGVGVPAGIVFGREGSSWGTYISFHNHPDDAVNIDALTESMRITAAGNVGIGMTPASSWKLEVNGPFAALGKVTSSGFINGDGTTKSLGLPVDASNGGGTYLLLMSRQWSNGANTDSSMYLIRCNYDGNGYTATFVAGTDGWTFSQSGGTLYAAGCGYNWNCRYAVFANF